MHVAVSHNHNINIDINNHDDLYMINYQVRILGMGYIEYTCACAMQLQRCEKDEPVSISQCSLVVQLEPDCCILSSCVCMLMRGPYINQMAVRILSEFTQFSVNSLNSN